MSIDVRTTHILNVRRKHWQSGIGLSKRTSKGRGKSGGARVITYTNCTSETEGCVYLVDVYDKADYSTVDVYAIKKVIADLDIL